MNLSHIIPTNLRILFWQPIDSRYEFQYGYDVNVHLVANLNTDWVVILSGRSSNSMQHKRPLRVVCYALTQSHERLNNEKF